MSTPNRPNMMGDLLFSTTQFIRARLPLATHMHGTSMENTALAIIQGVQIMEALQFSNISIASSNRSVIRTFWGKEYHSNIVAISEDFTSNLSRVHNFSFLCIHKKILTRFVNFLMSSR